MTCSEAEKSLAGYLDGAIRSRNHAGIREHLNSCPACRRDLEGYRRMALQLARVEPVPVPKDLATRIRVTASKSHSPWHHAGQAWSRLALSFENLVRPFAVPATGGLLTALAVFVLVVQNILVGVPLGGIVPNDLPLDLVQPARLESLAPFPIPGVSRGTTDSGALLLEAVLNSHGEVVSYRILSGPTDVAVQKQIDEVLMFSRFRPEISFGLPMDGGRVLLNFSEVLVRG
jgi:hypothetical protein